MNLLTEIREGFGISWDALRANKMRSVLTTLGIIIGIVTVTLMATAIEGLNSAFLKSISALGADVFYVSRNSWFNDSYDQIRMRLGVGDLLPMLLHAAVRANPYGGANDADDLLAVHHLLAVGAVRLHHLAVGVGKQLER